jgi:hypothetical protein
LLKAAQHDADARWQLYEQVAGVHRVVTEEHGAAAGGKPAPAGDGPPAAGGAEAAAGSAPAAAGSGEQPKAARTEEAAP